MINEPNQCSSFQTKSYRRILSCLKKYEANPLWQFCISYTFEENLSVLITSTITAPREDLNPGINDLWLVQLNFFLSPLSQCLPRNGSTWIILHYTPQSARFLAFPDNMASAGTIVWGLGESYWGWNFIKLENFIKWNGF